MRKQSRWAVALGLVSLGAWFMGPPGHAGDPPGTECSDCHEELVTHFAGNAHARLVEGDWFGQARACASCHGDATAHMESGDAESIRNFPGKDPSSDSALCIGCHATSHGFGAWEASEHARVGLSCVSCHNPHAGYDEERPSAALGKRVKEDLYEGCYECHAEVRAQMRLPSRHPVTEGKMDCGSCHDVHGNYPALLRTQGRVNDLCFECHPRQQGPFVFQHDPVEEDCSICHAPHGAVADHLLVQTQPFLCLQCHEGHFHAALESPESEEVTFGTIEPNVWQNPFGHQGMKRAFLTKCTQCHPAVHGSDNSSQGVSGSGANLTR